MKMLFSALSLLCLGLPALAGNVAPLDVPYSGIITLHVDATDINRRIFQVHEEIPVVPGPLTLHYPQWLPGGHDPSGPITQLAGLIITGNGQRLMWKRDPLDVFSFNLTVPAGTSTLSLDFQFLSPLEREQGRTVVTPEIINVQWNTVLLYPAGYFARQIQFTPSLKLPNDWKFGTALELEKQEGAVATFKTTNLDTLVDSPLYAGKYFKRFDLDPGAKVPVNMDVVADRAEHLEATPKILETHRKMIQQAYKLFGAKHFAHYNFLLSLSDRLSGIGLEHHQSSENSADNDYLTDEKATRDNDVLPHEFTHSWNGKFRRGADLATPNFNVPMQDSLLWVYEGQTQYWGAVLQARSGLQTQEQSRDNLARTAAYYDHREGRAWRDLEDTTMEPILSSRGSQGWSSWQRSEDYYSEGELLWFDADTLIRELSKGKKSLDDFAHAFFGVQDGRVDVLTYTFDDVVKTLNSVQAYDWTKFLRDRLDGHGPGAPLDGLARSGWKLVYTDKPNEGGWSGGGGSFSYSLGLSVSGKPLKINGVAWNSAAFKAGLSEAMTILAVNGMTATTDELKQAIIDGKKLGKPIVLLVSNQDHISTITMDYREGLRYPHLERIKGTPDRLADILAPRKN